MQGHADLVLVGDWDDAVEEIGDALPALFGGDVSGARGRGLGMRLGELPGGVGGIAATRGSSDALVADDLQVVLDGGMPAAAQFLIMIWSCSMSRSRSGLSPSIIAGCLSTSTEIEARMGGVVIMTSMPFFAARSFIRLSSSTVE